MTTKSRKKVLYYSPTIWGNTDFYRTTGVLPFISHPELILRDISHFGQINQWDLIGSDILIIQRPCNPNHLNLIKLAKQCKLKVILDFDDDILNVNKYNPTYIQYQQQRETIIECLDIADEIWCSTIGVKNSLNKGIVIPNCLNVDVLGQCADFNFDSNIIVWRGSNSHNADMYENPEFIIDFINSNTQFEFFFIGERFTYLEMRCGDNFNSVEGMPITQYFDYIRELKPLGLIFPLQDNILNRAKSNISWIESTLVGAAYFGNTMLPEFNIIGTMPIEEVDFLSKNIEVMQCGHSLSKKYIEEYLTLDKVNQLRINSLLSL